MTSHFCTCQNTACRCHPANHGQGCDLCIQKELRKGEIPSCFFNLVIQPGETVEDCTIQAFARRVLNREAERSGYQRLTADGIHLTREGAEIVARAWIQETDRAGIFI